MSLPDTVPGSIGRRVPTAAGRSLAWVPRFWLALVLGCWSLLWTPAAQAQGIELPQLDLRRQDIGLTLDFEVKLALSRAVEDALQRGVPLYFTAQAAVYKPRWYWRDALVARTSRTWRVSYQPLTSTWRVSFGALSQSFPSAQAALATVSKAASWKLAEPEQVEGGGYYVEFSYKLDSALLPRPMQLDLAAQSDWRLSVERTIKLE